MLPHIFATILFLKHSALIQKRISCFSIQHKKKSISLTVFLSLFLNRIIQVSLILIEIQSKYRKVWMEKNQFSLLKRNSCSIDDNLNFNSFYCRLFKVFMERVFLVYICILHHWKFKIEKINFTKVQLVNWGLRKIYA
jgi:hypothetical protein